MINILYVFVILTFLAVLGFAIRVCVVDARRRGKSPLLVFLLVVFWFSLGFIAWLLFRPEPLSGDGKLFRLEDHRIQ